MTRLKSIYTILFLTFLILFPTHLNANELTTTLIFYNDTHMALSHTPILKNDRMYARLRDLATILDLDITYDHTTQEAILSNGTDIFSYHLDSGLSFFNELPVFLDAPTFIDDDFTWVPVADFSQLFNFTATPNNELLITHYLGEGTFEIESTHESISYPIYDYTSVYSLFINDSTPAQYYTSGYFSAFITAASIENGILYLTFSPFTEVTYPDNYCLISDPRLLNKSPHTLTLPVSKSMLYTYLTYDPNTFSTAATTSYSRLYNAVSEGDLILAQLNISNGSILSIEQIYMP